MPIGLFAFRLFNVPVEKAWKYIVLTKTTPYGTNTQYTL